MRQHAWHAMTQHLLSKGETDTLVYIIDEAVDDLRSHGGLHAMSWASQVWAALADWISGPIGRTLPRELLVARDQLGVALLDAGHALQVSRDDEKSNSPRISIGWQFGRLMIGRLLQLLCVVYREKHSETPSIWES